MTLAFSFLHFWGTWYNGKTSHIESMAYGDLAKIQSWKLGEELGS
jgi:hypothetical protein